MRLVIDQAGAPKLTKSHAEFQKFLWGDTPESGEGHTLPNAAPRRTSGAASLQSSSAGASQRRLSRCWRSKIRSP